MSNIIRDPLVAGLRAEDLGKYSWVKGEFVNPKEAELKKWQEEVDYSNKTGETYTTTKGAKSQLAYWSPGGRGYQEALYDFIVKQASEQGLQDKLGVTIGQLMTNPQLASDPKALEAYKTNKDYVTGSTEPLSNVNTAHGFADTGEAQYSIAGGDMSGTGTTGDISGSVPFKSGLSEAQKQSIYTLLKTGRSFNETDAKNYAFAIGQTNWQQYVGKSGAQITGSTGSSGTTNTTGKLTQQQELDAAYARIQAGTGSQTDKDNIAYAQSKGIWKSPATNQTPEDQRPEAPSGDPSEKALSELEEYLKLRTDLTDAQKDYLRNLVKSNTTIDEAQKAAAQKALDEAKELTTPFYRSQFIMADDEMQRALTSTKQDTLSTIGSLQTKINQINDDLIYNRDQISLEQQAQMTDLLRQYKTQLYDLGQQAAEAGLAFSSPRKMAEQRLKEQETSSAEAVSRKTAQALRQLEVGSLRDIQSTTQDIADVTRKGAEKTLDIMRSGERTLGTSSMPAGYNVLGTASKPITGTLEDERQRAILEMQQTLLNKYDPLTGNLK